MFASAYMLLMMMQAHMAVPPVVLELRIVDGSEDILGGGYGLFIPQGYGAQGHTGRRRGRNRSGKQLVGTRHCLCDVQERARILR